MIEKIARLERLDGLGHEAVPVGAKAKLPVLVAPKGENVAVVGHRERVRVAAGHLVEMV